MKPASPGVEERHVFGDPVVFGAVVGVGGEVEAAGGFAADGAVHGVVVGALDAGHLGNVTFYGTIIYECH